MVFKQTLAGRNITTVKYHNLHTILLALLQHQHLSRVDLAKLTGLSNSTITNLVAELMEQGIAVEEGTTPLKRRSGAGRPRRALRLVPEARLTLGVHIGVGHIRLALTDLRANILDFHSFTHPLDKSAPAVLDTIVCSIKQIIKNNHVDKKEIIGIGVGASGLVDPETGVNVTAPNLGWKDVPIKDYLGARLELPIIVDNNVRAMALGEALFGSAQKVQLLAFVYARYGVGAGFVLGGQLFRGSGAGAGEIGHTAMTIDGGDLCRCGNRGCLEALVSEPSIVAEAKKIARHDRHGQLAHYLGSREEPTIEEVFAAARAGDTATQKLLDERARYMGISLANLVNILGPELILMGGIFSQGHDLLLPTVESTMRKRSFGRLGEQVRIRPTIFGSQSGTVGAAALALTALFYHPPEVLQLNPLSEVAV